ncbi:MAG: ATP-binding cassette domain-containing protein [Candidatus Ruminococcus intestinipullorum]|nr:ATP-binding cassette domain-containing protein [Candidatus Ruminococcus intestinipullorum]
MYIRLKNVTKRIKQDIVLDNISLEFQGGKSYGLQGKNGSGKTMLMRAICGLITLTEGEVDINGEILHKDISFPRSIGVLLENPAFLNGYTGLENLKLLADIQGGIEENELRNCLVKVGLDADDKRSYRKYSLGMKQKLGIAAAIMGNPDIVILDEPINAIDEAGVEQVRRIFGELKAKGSIIIVACHDREELELLSDEIIKISKGRIVV